MSTRVVTSDLFTRSYSDLDGSIKHRVLDFLMKLQERPDSPGLDLKTPEGVADKRIKTARVNDYWRAVLIELPRSRGFVLVGVKPHDDAYTYAARLRFGVNEVTGAAELVDEAALNEAITSATRAARPTAKPVLDGVRVRELCRFGIAEDIAEQLVTITDEDQLLAVADELPRIQGHAVLDLAAGQAVDDVWAALVETDQSAVDTDNVEEALTRPQSRLSFSDGTAEELRAALEEDLRKWRIWLHPLQRRLAYHDNWRGPYRVTGGAGTGKTVTAIHRARYLADRLRAEGSSDKVLFTTFTKNLAQNIKEQLRELAGSDITERVDVHNIDALVRQVLAAANPGDRRPELRGDSDLDEYWRTALTQAQQPWDVPFLRAEWSDVVLAQGIEDRAEYLKAARSGRGRRLSRPQRAEVWGIVERFTQLLNAENVMTFTQAAARAAVVVRQLAAADSITESGRQVTLPNYRHAVIDEAQDLHPAHWRFLAALIPPGTDNLFIVGDAHQRIYGRPVVLSRYGIETRGRSRRLTVNYRTSREILAWSLNITYGYDVDDLDGEKDTLAGARSEFGGPAPEMAGYATTRDERTALASKLGSWSTAGIKWSEVAVVAHDKSDVAEVTEFLRTHEIPAITVEASTDEQAIGEKVRVMTMHRAKGLEYRAVAITGAGNNKLPASWIKNLDDDAREAALARERSLLYVSGSRAREHLYVSWTGEPSELLNQPT